MDASIQMSLATIRAGLATIQGFRDIAEKRTCCSPPNWDLSLIQAEILESLRREFECTWIVTFTYNIPHRNRVAMHWIYASPTVSVGAEAIAGNQKNVTKST